MEYDFVTSPGVDPSQIRMRYEGAKSLSVNESGQLMLETDWGSIIEDEPTVYQAMDSERIPIFAHNEVIDEHSFIFSVGSAPCITEDWLDACGPPLRTDSGVGEPGAHRVR